MLGKKQTAQALQAGRTFLERTCFHRPDSQRTRVESWEEVGFQRGPTWTLNSGPTATSCGNCDPGQATVTSLNLVFFIGGVFSILPHRARGGLEMRCANMGKQDKCLVGILCGSLFTLPPAFRPQCEVSVYWPSGGTPVQGSREKPKAETKGCSPQSAQQSPSTRGFPPALLVPPLMGLVHKTPPQRLLSRIAP